MKKFFICFLTIVHWQMSIAQFKDDFSDNDFTTNPVWSGDVAKFIVSAGRLKLQSTAVASTAYLSTPSLCIDNASWEFYVQMDFNPSSANQSLVYLVSDNADLSASLKGYFVKIGNTADEVSLYRRDGAKEVKIIDGIDGRLNSSLVKVNVKVTRDDKGNWQLFSDTGAGTFIQEGVAHDFTYQTSMYFGIRCEYSATRSDKFYFDNFNVKGNAIVDSTPPNLQQIRTLSINELELNFSEPLDVTEAQNVMNYKVKELSSPITAVLYPDQRTVKITFDKTFPNGITCQLSISNIKDVSGNVIQPTIKEFQFFRSYKTLWRDVVISEILPNPNPDVGLPDAEYVELLNRSKNPVDLNKWNLTDGTSTGNLSSFVLLPNEYVVLTSSLNLQKFSAFPNVMGITNFPTLNNSGDMLVIKDVLGITIDSLSYTDRWYQDDDKKIGGWSLELIDPNNICAEVDNWAASEDKSGGTPGKQNSLYANKPDLTGPILLSAMPTSSKSVSLTFNEKLEKASILSTIFSFEPLLTVDKISFVDQALTVLSLSLKENIQTQTAYSVTANNVYDCAGNIIQVDFNEVKFALPEDADSLDIVVNEILFNPTPTGVDFVEIYNNSLKFIDLKNWTISNITDGILTNPKAIISTDFLLKPFSYLVFTANRNVLKSEYTQGLIENFLEVKFLPNLNDDEGSIGIVNEKGRVIDSFSYTKNMHSPFIKNEEGVSLERISFQEPTNDRQNWKSASSLTGYATPGYINSNSKPDVAIADETVTVDPEIFIPAYGSPDFTQIKYKFDKGGYIANVKICDIEGHEIKHLVNNQTLDTQGSVRWDGDYNDGNKAHIGYYFVLFEVFDSSGSVKIFRKRVIVATKF